MARRVSNWRIFWDLILIGVTSGVWLLWLLIKALRTIISK